LRPPCAPTATVDLDVSSPGLLSLGCSRGGSHGLCNARSSSECRARNPSCHSVDAETIVKTNCARNAPPNRLSDTLVKTGSDRGPHRMHTQITETHHTHAVVTQVTEKSADCGPSPSTGALFNCTVCELSGDYAVPVVPDHGLCESAGRKNDHALQGGANVGLYCRDDPVRIAALACRNDL
jgi:hypothetical protein